MFRGAVDLRKRAALEFRWGKLRLAYGAAIDDAIMRLAHLKRIRVYERDQGCVSNKNIRLIDIPDDIATGVQSTHCGSEIVRRAEEIAIVKFPAMSLTTTAPSPIWATATRVGITTTRIKVVANSRTVTWRACASATTVACAVR